MSTTMASEQTWTLASIDLALIRIETAINRRRRNPDGPVDDKTKKAIEEAHRKAIEEAELLKSYLEDHQSACPPAALACCNRLLEAQGT